MHVFVDKFKAILEQQFAVPLIRLPSQCPKKIIEQLYEW